MLYERYYQEVTRTLERVFCGQARQLQQTAALVADAFAADGLVYLFGCGHSHLITEDVFYRAGGFAPVCPILDSALMLHDGAVKSSCLERMPGLARPVFDRFPITQRDVLIVFSTSGINPVPTEMAQCAREKGVPVVAVVSRAYDGDASRHPAGHKLTDFADIILDNGVCHVSTISACTILQAVMVQAAELLWERGAELPVYVSGNLPSGMERNAGLIERYRSRIRCL